MLTDLLEGQLGNLTHEPLVLPRRKQARQLAKGMDMCHDHRVSEGRPEQIGERQRLNRALRTVDTDYDRPEMSIRFAHARQPCESQPVGSQVGVAVELRPGRARRVL